MPLYSPRYGPYEPQHVYSSMILGPSRCPRNYKIYKIYYISVSLMWCYLVCQPFNWWQILETVSGYLLHTILKLDIQRHFTWRGTLPIHVPLLQEYCLSLKYSASWGDNLVLLDLDSMFFLNYSEKHFSENIQSSWTLPVFMQSSYSLLLST